MQVVTTEIAPDVWGTNIGSRPESRELLSGRRAPATSTLGSLVDLLRSSPSVCRAVRPESSGGNASGIGAADF